jgi:hypothetical protein
MAQPGVDSFSADEKKSLFATSFLMWPLMIIGLIFKKDE